MALLRLESIRAKILLLALLATLVPALSTAALSYLRARAALTETLEGELRGIGSQTARELDLWLKERLYDLRVFVGSFEVIENLERLRTDPEDTDARSRLSDYLTGVQDRFPEYASLVVTDREGRAFASGASSVDPPELPTAWLVDLRIGDPGIGDPYLHDSLSRVVTTIAVPIQDAEANFIGALVATLTFEGLADVLAAVVPGDEGAIEVLSPDVGRVIVATGSDAAFQVTLPPDVLDRLALAEGGTVEYSDDDGEETVGTLRQVDPVDWAVLAHLPADAAYAPVARLTRTTLLLVTVLMVLVGSAAFVVGSLITRPLARLAEGAGAVAEGDLSVDLPVSGKDEVGYLTRVFNTMVARLRANAEALDEANAALRAQNAELERLSVTDALTGLYNRRHVMEMLDKEVHRASRYERSVSVLMLDIDNFKEYNDAHGHQAGDEVLAGMGEVLRDATRDTDIPARYGGEEFIVVLPDTDAEGAVDAAERIRKRLDREVFEGGKVTASIGAAEYPAHAETPTEVIAAADVALYAAKAAGRDRVVAAEG